MLNMTRRTGNAIVKAKFDPKKYAGLLAETLPTVIETEAENDRLLKVVEDLMSKGENLTPEEVEILKLLAHLIQEFEQKFYKPENATPREVLIELMAANDLKQVDIVHIFGSKGITSEVVNGKREISKANAKALAEFFHVSADVFI
jgi:HTH-type transcriptional regulator / antitoxin HigA